MDIRIITILKSIYSINGGMCRMKSKKMYGFVLVLLSTWITLSSLNVDFAVDAPASWAVESVDQLKALNVLDEGVFNNYADYTTRADFAYLGVKLYEYYAGKAAVIGKEAFIDTSDEWVLKAKALGIVNGYSDGSFKPDRLIKRDELAVLFVNVLKASGVTYSRYDGDAFADDADIADWAKESVYIAKANGIISGVGGNRFDAKSNATMQQSFVMLNNAIEAVVKFEVGTGQTAEPVEVSEVPLTVDLELSTYLGRDIHEVYTEFKSLYKEDVSFLDFSEAFYVSVQGENGQELSLFAFKEGIIKKATIGFNTSSGKPLDLSSRKEKILGVSVNQGVDVMMKALGITSKDLTTSREINSSLSVVGCRIDRGEFSINVEFTSDLSQIFGYSVSIPFF